MRDKFVAKLHNIKAGNKTRFNRKVTISLPLNFRCSKKAFAKSIQIK